MWVWVRVCVCVGGVCVCVCVGCVCGCECVCVGGVSVCVWGVCGVCVCEGWGPFSRATKMYYNLKLMFVTQVMENPENRSDLDKTPTNSPRLFSENGQFGLKINTIGTTKQLTL